MSFQLKSYGELLKEYDIQRQSLLSKHKVKIDEELPEPRRHQILFINTLINLLNETKQFGNIQGELPILSKKAQILSGALLVIQDEIASKEYKEKQKDMVGLITISFSSKKNAYLYNSLTEVLGVTATNPLDPASKSRMINSVWKFFGQNVFENGNTTKEVLRNNPFSSNESFSIDDFWNRCVNLEAMARKKIMANAAVGREIALKKLVDKPVEIKEEVKLLDEEKSSNIKWFNINNS